FNRTATREAVGTTSFRSSTRLVTTPRLKSDSPVMLPPGRARFVTNPVPTGSAAFPITMGITVVAFFAAWAAFAPTATKISTLRRTRDWTTVQIVRQHSDTR